MNETISLLVCCDCVPIRVCFSPLSLLFSGIVQLEAIISKLNELFACRLFVFCSSGPEKVLKHLLQQTQGCKGSLTHLNYSVFGGKLTFISVGLLFLCGEARSVSLWLQPFGLRGPMKRRNHMPDGCRGGIFE